MIAPNWLGDAVMATPFLLSLRRHFPEHDVDLLCRTYVADVFRYHSAVDRLLEYRRRGSVYAGAGALRRHRPAGGWEICYVLPPSFSAALIARFSGARRRIGYETEYRSLLLTDGLPADDYRIGHLSAIYVRLAEFVSGRTEEALPLPVVVPPYDWQEMLESRGLGGDYFVLAPGAAYGSAKVWPHERFSELAGKLGSATGWRIVAVGAAAERSALQSLLGTVKAAAMNLAGECTVRELLAVLRGARLVVGNDSGPVHLSAAVGRPTVAIFGSTSPAWTAPRGAAVTVVNADVDCAPCFKRECPEGVASCMERITPEKVFEASMQLIEEECRA